MSYSMMHQYQDTTMEDALVIAIELAGGAARCGVLESEESSSSARDHCILLQIYNVWIVKKQEQNNFNDGHDKRVSSDSR